MAIMQISISTCWPWHYQRYINLSENLKARFTHFIQENKFENVVCEMAVVLSRLQCVKSKWNSHFTERLIWHMSALSKYPINESPLVTMDTEITDRYIWWKPTILPNGKSRICNSSLIITAWRFLDTSIKTDPTFKLLIFSILCMQLNKG